MVNWFKTYRLNGDRRKPFIVDFGFPGEFDTTIFNDPLQEAINHIHNIANLYPPPYSVMCSGGVDSQAMAWAWHRSGIPFKVYHWSYCGENSHDTESLIKFLGSHDLLELLVIKNFDAKKFITSGSEYQACAKRYDTISPQMLTLIECVKKTPGTCLMAGNYLEAIMCGFNYTIFGLDRYAQSERENFIPFFFQSSPRLAYSFYSYLASKTYHSHTTHHGLKCAIYKNNNFEVLTPQNKQTGFEQIKSSFDNYSVSFVDKMKYLNFPSKRPFDILFRYKLFEVVPEYLDTTQVIHHEYIQTLNTKLG